MKIEELKNACDEVKMSEAQRRRIWYDAKREIKLQEVTAKRRRQRKISICCAAAMLFVICVGFVPALLRKDPENEPTAITLEEENNAAAMTLEEENNVWSHYLILGTDCRIDSLNGRSDTMIVASIEQKTRKVRLTTIPRVLVLPLSLEKKGQAFPEISEENWRDALMQKGFASAMDFTFLTGAESAEEGAEAAVKMVQEQLEIPLEGYIYVKWSGFIKIINQLGGVTLNVTEEDLDKSRSYINGFITEIVQETGIGSVQIEQTGEQVLDGVQALAWCRLCRPIGEQGRERRQIELVEKVLDKIKQCEVSELIGIANTAISSVNTNLTLEQIIELLKDAGEYQIESSWSLGDSGFVVDEKEWMEITDQEGLIQAIKDYFK